MRREKQFLLDEIKEKIDLSKAMIIARYDFLPPNLSWGFRDQLSKSGSSFEVVRKRIFLKAAELSGIKIDEAQLKGHIGIVFIPKEDLSDSAKVVFKFSEENQNILEVIGGRVDNKMMSASEVALLSTLPGINEMRAEFIALLVSPMSQMLSVLEAVSAES